MPRLLPAVLALALLPGCATDWCQPMLEVRHCVEGSERCVPGEGDIVHAWTAEWAKAWPDIDALMRSAPEGEHAHADWSEERRVAFWTAVGTDPHEPRREAFFEHGGNVYRVRVLTC
ncbi:MAG TPA: hypothetical protein VFH47_07555 [Candidatus Thermoplasmatota archaeon]|nr:hypothetical protein [Candidatus Thermoplasmatota archaeon]